MLCLKYLGGIHMSLTPEERKRRIEVLRASQTKKQQEQQGSGESTSSQPIISFSKKSEYAKSRVSANVNKDSVEEAARTVSKVKEEVSLENLLFPNGQTLIRINGAEPMLEENKNKPMVNFNAGTLPQEKNDDPSSVNFYSMTKKQRQSAFITGRMEDILSLDSAHNGIPEFEIKGNIQEAKVVRNQTSNLFRIRKELVDAYESFDTKGMCLTDEETIMEEIANGCFDFEANKEQCDKIREQRCGVLFEGLDDKEVVISNYNFVDDAASVYPNLRLIKNEDDMMLYQISQKMKSLPANCNNMVSYMSALRDLYVCCWGKFLYSAEFSNSLKACTDTRYIDGTCRVRNPLGFTNGKQIYKAMMSGKITYPGVTIPKYMGHALLGSESIMFTSEKKAIQDYELAKKKGKSEKKLKKLKKRIKKAHKEGIRAISEGKGSRIMVQSYTSGVAATEKDYYDVTTITPKEIEKVVTNLDIDIEEWVTKKREEERKLAELIHPTNVPYEPSETHWPQTAEEARNCISFVRQLDSKETKKLWKGMKERGIDFSKMALSNDPYVVEMYAEFCKARSGAMNRKLHETYYEAEKFAEELLESHSYMARYGFGTKGRSKKDAQLYARAVWDSSVEEFNRAVITGCVPHWFYDEKTGKRLSRYEIVSKIAKKKMVKQGFIEDVDAKRFDPRKQNVYDGGTCISTFATADFIRTCDGLKAITNEMLSEEAETKGKTKSKKVDLEDFDVDVPDGPRKYVQAQRKYHKKKLKDRERTDDQKALANKTLGTVTLGDISTLTALGSKVMDNIADISEISEKGNRESMNKYMESIESAVSADKNDTSVMFSNSSKSSGKKKKKPPNKWGISEEDSVVPRYIL
jgi:hypothetical protein